MYTPAVVSGPFCYLNTYTGPLVVPEHPPSKKGKKQPRPGKWQKRQPAGPAPTHNNTKNSAGVLKQRFQKLMNSRNVR
jgi:hypothetical protein